MNQETAVSTLNGLLKGEISAIETYLQAMEKCEGLDFTVLSEIKNEHVEAANKLRELIHTENGDVEHSSGPWGAWVKFIEGSAKLFGVKPALMALREGEGHGVEVYEDALEDPALEIEVKHIIRANLLPACARHIGTLDRLIAGD